VIDLPDNHSSDDTSDEETRKAGGEDKAEAKFKESLGFKSTKDFTW
jgi:hypothetical protein